MLHNRTFHTDFNIKPGISIRYEAEVFLDKNVINSINFKEPLAMMGK